MSSSTLASSFSVFVFDYGTKTNGIGRGYRRRRTILEKKRSIRTREAAEEYDDDSDGNESGSDDDAETRATEERTISTSRLRTLRRNGKTGSVAFSKNVKFNR